MTELEKKIYDIVRRIPKGKVATYGQIAEAAGNKKLARFVGNVMHRNPFPFWHLTGLKSPEEQIPENFQQVPCHRVVNSRGEMGKNFGLGGPVQQAEMLRKEGIYVSPEKLKIENLAFYAVRKL